MMSKLKKKKGMLYGYNFNQLLSLRMAEKLK